MGNMAKDNVSAPVKIVMATWMLLVLFVIAQILAWLAFGASYLLGHPHEFSGFSLRIPFGQMCFALFLTALGVAYAVRKRAVDRTYNQEEW